MINGDVNEFIDGLHYGDERFFLYDGNKYFLQGYCVDGKPMLELYVIENPEVGFEWRVISDNGKYPVEEFENAKIFNGKSFWEIEREIEWLDA